MRIGYLWRLGLVPLLTVLVGCLLAPPASAALALGGGAGIVVDGTYCTLATIGHDKTGDLVGFTAASCGGPDSPVVAEGSENLGSVGTVVALANDPGARYAVIKFDPAKITPIANFAGFVITGIDTSPYERGQPLCRLGSATGDFCGRIGSLPLGGPSRRMSMGGGAYQPGDNGGPATSDGLLLGLITGGTFVPPDLWGSPPHQFTEMVTFRYILDDVNSTGGPGAGFVPIPA